MRKEFVRKRPKWLIQFLFTLSPKVYEVMDTLEDVLVNFQTIKDAIRDSKLLERNPRLRMNESDNSIIINSGKNRPYLKFTILDNYYKVI